MTIPSSVVETAFGSFCPLTTSTQENHQNSKKAKQTQTPHNSQASNCKSSETSTASSSWSHYLKEKHKNAKENEQITPSQYRLQTATSHWQTRPWKEMESEFHKELSRYNIKTLNKHQQQQFAFLAALVVGIECPDTFKVHNVTLNLMDPTGEIKAIIPRALYNEHIGDLIKHSVIVLRNFGVLSLLPHRRCVIVSKSNLESIFTARNDIHNDTTRRVLIEESDIEKIAVLYEQQKENDAQRHPTGKVVEKQETMNKTSGSNVFNASNLDSDDDFNFDFELDHPTHTPPKKAKFQFSKATCDSSGNSSLAKPICPAHLSIAVSREKPEKRFKFGKHKEISPQPNKQQQMKETDQVAQQQIQQRQNDDELFNDIFEGMEETDAELMFKTQNVPTVEMTIRAQDPKNDKLVEEIFDGMDASFMFDDF